MTPAKARLTPARRPRALAFVATVVTAVLTALPVSPGAASPPTPASGAADVAAEVAAEVAAATRALERTIDTPGAAWGADPRGDRLTVSYDDTVTPGELARLTSVTEQFPDVVRVERLSGRLRPHISGGDGIYGGGSRCTLGFNVHNRYGAQYFLTAGHCANIAHHWYAADGTTYLGPTVGASFPGDDYGIVRYDSGVPRPGDVNLHNGSHRDITSAGDANYGEPVCVSSPGGEFRCGPVTGVNVTVNYPQGTVYGLVRVGICPMPGDSGAPVFQDSRAVGTVSGGSASGCVTYYQPILEALRAYGVSVY